MHKLVRVYKFSTCCAIINVEFYCYKLGPLSQSVEGKFVEDREKKGDEKVFASFKMELSKLLYDNVENYYSIGKKQYDSQKKSIQQSLDAYLAPNGSLKACEIEGNWFPTIKADVFLSHSHKDEKTAIAFAGYLNELGISSFVDSCVWGYANDLIKQIDDEYCVLSTKPSGGHTYDYDKRNYSTAHVHMILNGALLKMIDNTECLIFLDTPNSLKTEDLSNGTTNSCWVYSELLMSSCIKTKAPIRKGVYRLEESFDYSELSVDYDIDISHLIKLSLSDISKAAEQSVRHGPYILDQLYIMKKIYTK